MVFLIAELGVNWDGDFDLLEKMASKSKQVGFDAVKLQSFNEQIIEQSPIRERLIKSSVLSSNIQEISDII